MNGSSASSSISLLDPRTKMETVFVLGTPVTFTNFPSLVDISSTRSAVPSLSGVNESIVATGVHPIV